MAELRPFEVYAIRYATVERRGTENYIGGDPHETERMDYFVWLARHANHTVVIDTGFDEQAARRRKRQFLRSPADGLRLLGVDPQQVQDVIITHMHYDHGGDLPAVPACTLPSAGSRDGLCDRPLHGHGVFLTRL